MYMVWLWLSLALAEQTPGGVHLEGELHPLTALNGKEYREYDLGYWLQIYFDTKLVNMSVEVIMFDDVMV